MTGFCETISFVLVLLACTCVHVTISLTDDVQVHKDSNISRLCRNNRTVSYTLNFYGEDHPAARVLMLSQRVGDDSIADCDIQVTAINSNGIILTIENILAAKSTHGSTQGCLQVEGETTKICGSLNRNVGEVDTTQLYTTLSDTMIIHIRNFMNSSLFQLVVTAVQDDNHGECIGNTVPCGMHTCMHGDLQYDNHIHCPSEDQTFSNDSTSTTVIPATTTTTVPTTTESILDFLKNSDGSSLELTLITSGTFIILCMVLIVVFSHMIYRQRQIRRRRRIEEQQLRRTNGRRMRRPSMMPSVTDSAGSDDSLPPPYSPPLHLGSMAIDMEPPPSYDDVVLSPRTDVAVPVFPAPPSEESKKDDADVVSDNNDGQQFTAPEQTAAEVVGENVENNETV